MIRTPIATTAVLLALLAGGIQPAASVPVAEQSANPDPPATSGPQPAADAATGRRPIAERLEAVPGMHITGSVPQHPGWFFRLTYRQPADHADPSGQSFRQQLRLLHVGVRRPMVLHTSGYGVDAKLYGTEPTALLGANQISTEQRFFRPSRPRPPDWDDLTIRQAAADHHRLVEALQPIYRRAWVSTGASKGGMVSVYHRRFYPRDVAGTIAYVAPNDVVNRVDAYTDFIAAAGPRPACNRALRRFQVEALQRRDHLVPRLERYAEQHELEIDRTLGSWDRAFEAAVLDTPFSFWSYFDAGSCRRVPDVDDPDRRFMRFIERVEGGWYLWSDNGLVEDAAYFRHAAAQLGWPNLADAPHLDGLLHYRQAGSARACTPVGIRPRGFDRVAMADVDRWVRRHGRRLLFVYGEDDPWSAEPFRLGRGSRHSKVFVAPRANHATSIRDLRRPDRRTARAMVRRWGEQAGAAPDRFVPDGVPPAVRLRLRPAHPAAP